MIPPIFAGKRIAIVAGGPSLREFDWRRLDGWPVVAINRAHEVLPAATMLWWSDCLYFQRHSDAIMAHPAPWKITALRPGQDRFTYPKGVHVLTFSGADGYDETPGCIRHGKNGGYAALHVVAKYGPPRRVILLGYDFCHAPGGATHFHSGHGRLHQESTLQELMLPSFAGLVEPLARMGVEVVNANPDSRLTHWPRVTIDEALG